MVMDVTGPMREKIVQEVKTNTDEIRSLLNHSESKVDDSEALEKIENYVFRQEKSGCRKHSENDYLVRRVFLSLRSEMDILQPYVDDPDITEIMVNGKDSIFIEKNGRIEKLPFSFDTSQDLEELIRRIATKVHREINDRSPIADARLSDGSRVNAVLSGVALNGPILTIRKFPKAPMTMEDLIKNGTLHKDLAIMLTALVRARYNIFISGGTSSGKTTLLNVLSQHLPSHERVVVIEDSAELQINHVENIVRLECKNANARGDGAIHMADLVRNSLRMRPDRIIVGEVRGEEVMDMIQAMNTGHDGSMSTGHANSVRGMLKRLEAMFLQGTDIPVEAIRSQIAEGIDIIVHLSRLRGGRRHIMEIAELIPSKDGSIGLNHLYRYGSGFTGNRLVHREKLDIWK